MTLYNSLITELQSTNQSGLSKHRIWLYKEIVVIDLDISHVRIAFDLLVENDNQGTFLAFGRDNASQILLEKIIKPKMNWHDHVCIGSHNKIQFFQGAIVDITKTAEKLISLANKIKKEIELLTLSEISDLISTINEPLLLSLKERLAAGKKLKVGFLVSERQKWNCQNLWEQLRLFPNIDARIYLHIAKKEELEEQVSFFKKIDPSLICLYNTKTKKNANIKNYEIDIVFCQQPWAGIATQMRGAVGEMLFVYMHYGFLVYANSKMQYRHKGFHPYLWRYFSQSHLQKAIHLKHDPAIANRSVVTGYPKLDIYLDPIKNTDIWPENDPNKKKTIYAPHHSLHNETLKISTFSWNFNLLLMLSQKYSEQTEWIYKPHGRLQYTVVKNNVMTKGEYNKYLEKWMSQKNTSVYNEGNYFDIFRTSDVLITDCGSFLGEYYPTGKPIIWLISDISTVKLNEIGSKLSKGFYKVRTRKELLAIYYYVVIQGNDPLKEYRLKVIKEMFPLKEKSSISIINYLKNIIELKDK